MDYTPLLQTLIGGLLALLGGFTATWFTQWLNKRGESKNIASAFYGEISSLLRIIEVRGYVQGFEDNLRYMQSNSAEISFTPFRVTKNYFRVYEDNTGKIGLLNEPLPEKIISFYTYIFAALEDIEEMNRTDFSASNAELTKTIEEILHISRVVNSVGNEILSMIKPGQNVIGTNLVRAKEDNT